MKIKKFICAAALAAMVLGACGSDSSSSSSSSASSAASSSSSSAASESSSSAEAHAEIDINAVADALKSEVSFAGNMVTANEELAKISLSIPDGSEGAMYIPESEQVADAFGVYKCADEAKAEELVNGINGYINDSKDEMQKYIPEEVPKLDNAIIKKSGSNVVFCITSDNAKAKEVIERLFK